MGPLFGIAVIAFFAARINKTLDAFNKRDAERVSIDKTTRNLIALGSSKTNANEASNAAIRACERLNTLVNKPTE